MMMLVIGALVIGYLLYFLSSSIGEAAARRIADREADWDAEPRCGDEETLNRLEARVAVLERLLGDPDDREGSFESDNRGER